MSAETKQPIQWLPITEDSLPEFGDIVWYGYAESVVVVTPSMSHRSVQSWATRNVFYFMRVGRPE